MEQRTNRIEEWILRVGRWFGGLVGTVAAVTVALGVLVLAGGLVWWPLGTPWAPTIPPKPAPPPAVTLADAQALVTKDLVFNDTAGEEHRMRVERLAEVASLKDAFPDTTFTWDNVYEDYCRYATSYGCAERARRLTRTGVARHVIATLDQVNEDQRAFMLAELGRLLPTADVEARGHLVVPVVIAELKRAKAEQTATSDWEDHKSQLESEYRTAQYEHSARWKLVATAGVSAIGGGLSAALGICLVVAALAIERHLRALAARSAS